MKLPAIPKISKNTLKTITDITTNGSRLVWAKTNKVSPHIKTVAAIVVEPATKKADYLHDLAALLKQGLSVTDSAEILGISTSYAYKLRKMLNIK